MAPGEAEPVVRIARWMELYHPTAREGCPVGSMRYVRWRVQGHDQGEAYRVLFGLNPEIAPAAFGLFGKLLELAADEPRDRRDGTIYYRGKPATVQLIAFMTLFPEALVRDCLALLSNDVVRWIERVPLAEWAPDQQENSPDGTTTAHRRDNDATPTANVGTPTKNVGTPSVRTGIGTETEHIHIPKQETETGMANVGTPTAPASGSRFKNDGVRASGSIPEKPGNMGTLEAARSVTHMALARMFKLSVPDRNDRSPRARQQRADRTTLRTICDVCITGGDVQTLQCQTAELENAAEAITRNRTREVWIRAFVGECKNRYPPLAQEFARRKAARAGPVQTVK